MSYKSPHGKKDLVAPINYCLVIQPSLLYKWKGLLSFLGLLELYLIVISRLEGEHSTVPHFEGECLNY